MTPPENEKIHAYSDSHKVLGALRRFGSRIKNLELVHIPIFHLAEFEGFLNKTPLLESLAISFRSIAAINFELRMSKLKEFCFLKKISFKNTPGVASIMEKVPAGSIEEFTIDSISELAVCGGRFQKILKSQYNIKKIKLGRQKVSLKHLKLDSYELEREDGACLHTLIETLYYQEQLREFRTSAIISNTVFLQISTLTKLESLHVPIDIVKRYGFEKIQILVNLKDLSITESSVDMWMLINVAQVDGVGVVRVGLPQVSDIVLPKLEKLTLNLPFRDFVASDFAALSQNLGNLLVVCCKSFKVLDFAIENVHSLKSLQVIFKGFAEFSTVPTEIGNSSLEELKIIGIPFFHDRVYMIYDTINACSNLKRIALSAVKLDEQLELTIRRHPGLTHIYLELLNPELLALMEFVQKARVLAFQQVINLFRDLPGLKRLSFKFLNPDFIADFQEYADNNNQMKLMIQDDFVELMKGNTDTDVYKHFGRGIYKRSKQSRS